MKMILTRRTVLKGAAALGGLALLPSGLLAADEHMVVSSDMPFTVGTRNTRLTSIFLEGKAKPKGVVLFSTGHGSWPARYQRLTAILAMQGYVVLAPLHVDSVKYPDVAKFTREQSFPERLADMAAVSAYAAKRYPGVAVIAAGHSFGTLIALCLGGALPYVGPLRNPAVQAVLGFSTPGKIPGLIQPSAYQALAVPTMIVTGTADRVPGLVTDPADHLFPFESAPAGGKYALVVDAADHELVAGASAGFDHVIEPVRLFVRGYGLHDANARAALAAWTAATGDRFLVREA